MEKKNQLKRCTYMATLGILLCTPTGVIELNAQSSSGTIEARVESTGGDAVSGASFNILDMNNNVVKTMKTDNNGVADAEVTPGTYVVQETSTSEGLEINDTKFMQAVDAGETSKINRGRALINEASDVKTGQLCIKTKDTNNNWIGNVEVGIYDENNQYVSGVKTSSNGIAVTEQLPVGKYTLKEADNGIKGYNPDSHEYSVNVVEDQVTNTQDLHLSAYNSKVKVNIVDEAKRPVVGAKVKVTGPNDFKQTLTTDENGQASTSVIAYGKYSVSQVSAPNGYDYDENMAKLDVHNDGDTVKTYINQARKEAIYGKVVDQDGNGIINASFTIKNHNGTTVGSMKSDAFGVFESSPLSDGTYTIKQTDTKQGYSLDSKTYTVKLDGKSMYPINADGKIVNPKINGITFNGTVIDDDTQSPVKGARFTLRDAYGKLLGTYDTNSNGVVSFNDIPDGNYTIEETSVNRPYLVDDTIHQISIYNGKLMDYSNNGAYTTFNNGKKIVNHMRKANIAIFLQTADNEGKMCQFGIYDKDGNLVKRQYTDESGYTKVNLPIGQYTVRQIGAAADHEIDKNDKSVYMTTEGQTYITSFTNN